MPSRFLFLLSFLVVLNGFAQGSFPDIRVENGDIHYVEDSLGNKIPDFSYSGYHSSSIPIPDVPVRIFVSQKDGDATQRIQAALDHIGKLKPDNNGFRGAVLLDEGTFEVSGTLYMRYSGVVLKGKGNSQNETRILGTGINRESIIRILGNDDRKYGDTLHLNNSFTPLGTKTIVLNQDRGLTTGDNILIRKTLSEKEIEILGMEEFGGETGWIGWKPEDWDIKWDRRIEKKEGNELTLDAPLTMSFEAGDTIEVIKYEWPGRIEEVGIENLLLESTYDSSNLKDEQHRWLGINIENAKNIWVRQVNFKHLAGGAVSVLKSSKQVTVEDCQFLKPVSEIAAFRRHSFYTEGQQTLFQRCFSEYGYHDFAVGGYGTAGPNAFVQCEAFQPYSFSGAIGSLATGVLFDIVNIDGNALSFKNRGQGGRGAGWTAANSVMWESSASLLECYSLPIAPNWAFGVWGQFAGNGIWKNVNSHISPRSLFYAQLEKRFNGLPVDPQILELGSEPSTSPTIEAAEELTRIAENDLVSIQDWINEAPQRNPIPIENSGIRTLEELNIVGANKERKENEESVKFQIINGWLTAGGKVVLGKRTNNMWWRGSLREDDIQKSTPHITRFAPGRRGTGLTDELEEVVEFMNENNIAAFEHNYGLWYDRRMDDHERVRRIDADTWPPFYEQPFARSGEGVAWDHLSKYDLEKPNEWYWSRLRRFAELAEKEEKFLIHHQYFQHNILEAGAHWSSSPWRPANNINDTGFPEPPPYAGDKRIFLARQFYDVEHPTRRSLHQNYIRQSLENFKDQGNVIQLTSEEFTGPLHFVQYWIDVIGKWEKETGNDALTGLSATKDVQDAILEDKELSETVDIIDIRYWHYKENGEAYAPEGGKNLAPRQHARKMSGGKETEEQVYRAVREYRQNYPGKAVMYSTNGSDRFGWAALMGGASLASIPEIELPAFYSALPEMDFPEDGASGDLWMLEKKGENYLIDPRDQNEVEIDLRGFSNKFSVYQINRENGEIEDENTISGNEIISLKASKNIIFITKRK